jgi:hypothetical protein
VKPARSPQTSLDAREIEPKGHGAKPEAVRERAILALLSERTIEQAAQRAGVNERRLRRWQTEDDAFKAAYDQARLATFQAAMNRIHALTGRAVDTLEDLLGETKHPAVRLGAARTVAEIGIHQHDAEAILRKLDDAQQQRSTRPRSIATGVRSAPQ